MLNHSVLVSAFEEDLGFALINLPSTDDIVWNGKFARVCAKQISESNYVMKFESDEEPEYYQMKWGVPNKLPHLSPAWIPSDHQYADPEEAIHHAQMDMADILKVIEHPLPTF